MKPPTKKPKKPAPKPKAAAKTPAARAAKAAATKAAKPPARPSRKAPPPAAIVRAAGDQPAPGELRGVGDCIELPSGIVATVADAEQIVPSRFNAEGREPDAEMVQSIEDRGVIEPLVVRPVNQAALDHWQKLGGDPAGRLFELVCGEKRWKGAQRAGAQRGAPPLRVLLLVIVRPDLTDQEVADLQFIENFHRSSLTPLQEIDAFVKYQREFGGGPPEIAKHVNKPPAYVAKRIKVGLHLPLPGREALAAGRLLLGAAVEVSCIPDAPAPAAPDADRVVALSLVMPRHDDDEPIPVREAREIIVRRFHLQMVHARFDITDATLVQSAGSCMKCPKRSANQLAMFEADGRKDDRCMDRACWEAKTTAAWERQKQAAEKAGQRVLDAQAQGPEGDKARAILNQPTQHGLVPLDMPCDVLHDAKIEAAQARIEQAEETGDDAAKAAAEAELDALENGPDDATIPTWRDVLGAAAPAVALGRARPVWSDRTELVELADERTALQALKTTTGITLPAWLEKRLAAPAGTGGEDKPPERPNPRPTHEQDRRRRELRRERLTAALVLAGEEAKADVGFWRALVFALVSVYSELGFEDFLRRREWPVPKDPHDDAAVQEIIAAQAAKMPQQKLRGLVVEIVCQLATDDALPAFARLLGQDAGAIIAAADAEAGPAEAPAAPRKSRGSAKRGTCRFCGCTAEHACELDGVDGGPPQGCAWIDGTETICSACAPIVELAAAVVTDGQPCDHCEGSTTCKHFAEELYRRATEEGDPPFLAGGFEKHKARIGACLAFAVSRAKKPAGKKGATKNAPSTTTTEAATT